MNDTDTDGLTAEERELEAKAKAATPGPWLYVVDVKKGFDCDTGEPRNSIYRWIKGGEFSTSLASIFGTAGRWDEDGAHIAAANPQAILALLAALRAERLARVRADNALSVIEYKCSGGARGEDVYLDLLAEARDARTDIAEILGEGRK